MIDQSEPVYWAYGWCFLGGRGRNGFDASVNDIYQQNALSLFQVFLEGHPQHPFSRSLLP